VLFDTEFSEIGLVGVIENCFSFSNALLCFAKIRNSI